MPRLSEDGKRAVTIFVSTTIVFSALAYVAVTPKPREQFFQIYVLGETRKAERYYPNNNTNIPIGQVVKWHLGATNFMGFVQYVVIKVKLGNSTIKAPDDANYVPSPAPTLLQFKKILMNNETWEFPLVWTLEEISVNGSVVSPTLLEINGIKVRNSQVGTLKGYSFRIIFELWTFDPENESFVFGWRKGADRRAAWLQVWFNATSPTTKQPTL